MGAKKLIRFSLLCVGLAMGLSFGSGIGLAQGQGYQALADEVSRLRRDLQDVQREVYSSYSARATVQEQRPAAPPAAIVPTTAASARVTVRMSELENILRGLTGQIEELAFRVDQATQQLNTLAGDVDFRLRALEEKAGISPLQGNVTYQMTSGPAPIRRPANELPQMSTVPRAEEVLIGKQTFNTTVRTTSARGVLGQISVGKLSGDAAEQYEAAKALLLGGDFAGAEAAFQAFLVNNETDELAPEAQYWLGEAFFVRGAFQESGRAFTEGLAKYPNSPRGPESLLKLAMSLSALKQSDAACATFGEMERRYPNAVQTIVQRVKVEKSKAGCK